MVRMPSASSFAPAFGPMPFTLRTASGQMRDGTSPAVITVMPPGLSRSEAIFARSLFGVTPTEQDSPVAARTAACISTASARAAGQGSGCPANRAVKSM